MAFLDLPLDQLQTYKPERTEPSDFDIFWQETLDAARAYPLGVRFDPVDSGLALIDAYDVSFSGYGAQTVRGWYLRPAGQTGPLPCIVNFIGYGGGRGFPHDWLLWPAAGYAAFIMDTRGQGSSWSRGETPDLPDGANPHTPGFMTQGVLDPHTYYYRRVYTDAVRAVEAVRLRGDVDTDRIAVVGASQGGGISLAVAGLMPDGVAACMPSVPFLCHFRGAVGKTDAGPYTEIVRYLAVHRGREDQVFRTLDYFDGVNFAPRIRARCLFSTAEMDAVCPPSSVFAAYNHLNTSREMHVYRFNGHEGGGSDHNQVMLRYINDLWRDRQAR